jgi:O-antigen ligase
MLREVALNLRAANPQAVVLAAALAPTLETGPLNLNELDYLDQLYQAGAAHWVDVVAVQPYGFDADPLEPPHPQTLNFRRAELLRQVMLRHGQANAPVWATAFGYNALPANWAGSPSPWKSNTAAVQAQRTAQAIAYARGHWPWLGSLLAIRWDAAGLDPADPSRGFALVDAPPVRVALQAAALAAPAAGPGRYPARHPTGHYQGEWRFAAALADVPRREPRTLTIPFEGTRLDLHVNRGPYRGYLWVTLNGEPANALPRDEQGRSYVVLFDPLRGAESVTLARHLPPGRHTAVIEAEGGWGQWAIGGWSVVNEPDTRPAQTGLAVAAVAAAISGAALLWLAARAWRALWQTGCAFSGWVAENYSRLGEPAHIAVTFALAGALYLAPGVVGLGLLPLLALAVLLRPDLGLALVAFSLSFFQRPVPLPLRSMSPVELALALTVAGFAVQFLINLLNGHMPESPLLPFGGKRGRGDGGQQKQIGLIQNSKFKIKNFDLAALALAALALAATFAAPNFGVSMREWRVVVAESVGFYFLVRLGLDFGPAGGQGRRWAWRLAHAFVAGASLQAIIALYLYFFTDRSITAEGVHRALGLAYGSPNNLALFLDRAWPMLLAVAALPGPWLRRALYAAGLAVVSLALYLTFSKGALLVGLPAGLAAMAIIYIAANRPPHWRRVLAAAAGGLAVIALAIIPLSQTARFRTTFDLSQGSTGFFRLKLWQASLAMLRDHWPLGIGLDNFLYRYRTRYILPTAWQEPNLSHPHNILLDFGTRLGVGGLVVLLWLQVAFWASAWRLYRRSAEPLVLGLMGSMAVFVAHGLVDNSYFLVDLAFAFFLTAGLVMANDER